MLQLELATFQVLNSHIWLVAAPLHHAVLYNGFKSIIRIRESASFLTPNQQSTGEGEMLEKVDNSACLRGK